MVNVAKTTTFFFMMVFHLKASDHRNVDSSYELCIGVIFIANLEAQTFGRVANLDSIRLVPNWVQRIENHPKRGDLPFGLKSSFINNIF
jgi:hypothetical protein